MKHDQPILKMIREFVALGRSRFQRPSTPEGNPDAQAIIVRGLEIQDEEGNAVEVTGPLVELLAPRAPFFDEAVIRAIDGGISQIVNIGAGFDDRALRFRHPHVSYFELDFPQVIDDKRRRVQSMLDGTNGLTFVPIDLERDDVSHALRNAGHDEEKATLFIAEHVMLFIDESAVRSLLTGIRAVAAHGSTLVLSAETHPSGMSTDAVLADIDRVMFGGSGVVRSVQSIEGWNGILSDSGWRIDESRGFAVDHFAVPGHGDPLQIQTRFISAIRV